MRKALNTSELANIVDIKGSNKSPQEQIVKIVVTNDANGVPQRDALGNFETMMKKMANACEQASNSMAYFSTNLKEINTQTGLATQEFFVQASEAENVVASMKRKAEGMFGQNLNVSNPRPVLYSISDITLHGKQAQTRAKSEIADVAGGQILPSPTKKNPDRYKVLMPLADGISPDDKSWVNARKKVVFSGSMKLSRIEQQRRDAEAEALRIQEEERKTAKELLAIKKEYKEVERARLENAKLIQKMEAEEAKEKASVDKEVAKYFADEEAEKKKKEEDELKAQAKEEAKEKAYEKSWKKMEMREDEALDNRISKGLKKQNSDFSLEDEQAFLAKNKPIKEAKSKKELADMIDEANDFNDNLKAEDAKASSAMSAEKKQIAESSRKTASIAKMATAVLVTIADITRRILTATLKNASKMDKDAVEAHDMGISYMERRDMDLFDKAHGLPEGSTFKAVQATQSMFGDVTNLDEKAIGVLARVMGGDVSKLVQSGLGSSDPSLFVENIMDAYFKQWKSGKNSLGQDVGQQQARMELVQSLKSVSTEYATLFSRMVDDYQSGAYGKFNSYGDWRNTTETNRSGLTDADTTLATEVGKKYNEIIAIVDDLKTSFFTRLAGSMDGLLTKIKNIRVGQTADNKIEEDIKNKQANTENYNLLSQELKAYNVTSEAKINELAESTPISINGWGFKNYKAEEIADFTYNAEILAGIHSGIYDKEYFKKNKDGTGLKSDSEIAKYIQRGKDIYDNAIYNKEVQDEISRSEVILQRQEEIKEANANEIGSGKIADLTLSSANETVLAQKILRDAGSLIAGKNGTLSTFAPEVQNVVKESYADYLVNNPKAIAEAGKRLSKGTLGKKVSKAMNARAKELGLKNAQVLPIEEKARILAEYDAENWYSYNFIPQQYISQKGKAEDTFLQKNGTEAFIKNLNSSDSFILSELIRSGVALANGDYRYYGSQNEHGEYVLRIVEIGKDGKETPATSISLGKTNGQEIVGTFNMKDGGFNSTNASMQ